MHARQLSITLVVLAAGNATLGPSVQAQAPTAPTITLSGVGYAQYVYQDAPVHTNNFDITRAYVNVIGRFAGGIGTRVTADIYRLAPDNSLQYRLKYAYVAWTPANSKLTYKLGQIHTPFIDWEETLWDYRMQGQMAMERGGYLASSDFGLGVDGRWGADKINLQVGIYNGENYNGGTGDFRKDVMGRVSVRVMDTDDSSRVGGLRLTGYAQVGKPTTGGTRNRFLGMASYRSRQITLAGEFAVTKDTVTGTPLAETNGSVISAFGVYRLTNSKVAVLARVDLTDPNTDVGNNKQTRLIGGVSYQLSTNVRLLADLDHLSFENGATDRNLALFQAQFTF